MSAEKKPKISIQRKAQLIKAAFEVVGQKGYSNFTIRDIAVEAGLSTGLVHYYFENKEDLFFTLFKEMQSNIEENVNAALSQTDDPLNQLRSFIEEAFMMIKRESQYFHLLFNFWSQINTNDRLKGLSKKLYESYRKTLVGILESGVAYGCFKEMDTEHYAATIVALLQGSVIQYVIDEDVFEYEDFARQQKERITHMVLIRER